MKIYIYLFTGLLFLCFNTNYALSEEWSSARPDGHAPIGIMGDHYHKAGEWMFSYRFMTMPMENNIESSTDIGDADIFANYMVAPQTMSMQMHMIGVMYAPINNLTLMIMANYLSMDMDLKSKMGVDFTTHSSGVGDVSIYGLVKIFNKHSESLHLNIGLSIPTGAIDQKDNTPMANDAQLAYPMQLGSGTWDPSIGGTFLGQTDMLSWGLQATYKMRIGDNSHGYHLGNRLSSTVWSAIKANDYLSFSASLNYLFTDKINGADPDMNPTMMPLFNTENSGRDQLDLGIGANFLVPRGMMKNIRVAAEIKFPITQNVNGIQMKSGINGVIGLQYAIGHGEK